MPNPWVIGNLIQGQYLNSLQEAISDWSDNVLLQASGASVVMPATPTALAEIVIGGQMRAASATKTVVLAGPAGDYNIFATTRRGTAEFELRATQASTTTAQYSRLIGVAEFDGVNVVDVKSAVREINVSHIGGHPPEQNAPRPAAIPAGRDDATLDPGWLPDLDDIRIPVGGVREVWLPAGETFVLPDGWRELNGQTVQPADHAFPGVVIPVTLPDVRNKHVRGGNVVGVFESGTNTALNMNHTHNLLGTTHDIQPHTHDVDPHQHVLGFHNADLPNSPPKVNVSTAIPTDRTTDNRVKDQIFDLLRDAAGNALPGDALISGVNADGHQTDSAIQDLTPLVGPSGGGLSSNGPGNVTVTPRSLGVVYIMRVK